MSATLTKRKPTSNQLKADVLGDLPEAHPSAGIRLRPLMTGRNVVDIAIGLISVHKHNRKITDESVADLAESIRELGQLEPATVRPLGKGKYELISGERRFRACKVAGKSTLACIIIEDSTTDGLVRLAAANSNRQDLNPIDRANLMAQLMKPIKDGGSGLSRMDAGKAVGLMSDSGSKNALRFLKLPKSIQDLIAEGKLSERAARRLIPFCELEAAMEVIAKELQTDDRSRIELSDDEEFPWFVQRAVENHARPMDKRSYSSNNLVKGRHTNYPKLFEGDAGLPVLEIKFDDEVWELTTDVKAWEKLQAPIALKEVNGKGQREAKADTKAKGKAAPEISGAERIKAANQRLDKWTFATWIPCALRCELATKVESSERALLLPSLIAVDTGDYDKHLAEALTDLKADVPTIKLGRNIYLPARGGSSDKLVDVLFGRVLWPAPDLETLPDLDRLCYSMNRETLHMFASRCDVTLTDFWTSALKKGNQRELLRIWLQRHTTEQLTALWSELRIREAMPKTHGHIALALLEQHDAANQLPIPKRFKVKA